MSAKVPRFIAIPVGQGDAFYLKTPSGSVLVDGGHAISGFAHLFERTTGAEGADIVICTHNDADHANGLIGFLETGLDCAEVWLPGRWLSVLPHVLNPTAEVTKAVAEQALEAARKLRGHPQQAPDIGTLFEIYGASLAQDPPRHGEESGFLPPNFRPAEVTDRWLEALAEGLERAVWGGWEEELKGPWGWLLGRMPYWWIEPPYWWQWHIWRVACENAVACALFLAALDAAERIRRIAVAAYHRGVAVRWFEYTAGSPQGGTGWLRPLNGREVADVPRVPTGQLFAWLALTTANRESLVFWADLDDCPGALFTADSDLKDVDLPPNLSGAIITAPHHGSEANAAAYSKVRAHFEGSQPKITWVRSDGRFRKRPGPPYLSAPGRRVCTICRHGGPQTKQAVKLSLRKGSWARVRGVRSCNCR